MHSQYIHMRHCKILRLCPTFHVYRFYTEDVSSSRRKEDVVVLTLISLIYLHFHAKDSSEIDVTTAVLMGVHVF